MQFILNGHRLYTHGTSNLLIICRVISSTILFATLGLFRIIVSVSPSHLERRMIDQVVNHVIRIASPWSISAEPMNAADIDHSLEPPNMHPQDFDGRTNITIAIALKRRAMQRRERKC